MCDPAITGAPGSVPARTPTTLPMRSIVTASPSSRIQPATRSRPPRSASVSARRLTPPPAIAPTAPSAAMRAARRVASMRRSSAPAFRISLPCVIWNRISVSDVAERFMQILDRPEPLAALPAQFLGDGRAEVVDEADCRYIGIEYRAAVGQAVDDGIFGARQGRHAGTGEEHQLRARLAGRIDDRRQQGGTAAEVDDQQHIAPAE